MDDIITTVEKRVSSREFNSIRWYSVTRWGDEYLRSILNRKTNVAHAWRWKQIFGPKHPSLGMWAPEPESFRKVKYKDLSKLHKDYVQKTGNLELFVAGGKTESQVKPLLNQTFGQHDSWRSREPAEPPESNFQGIRGKIIPDLTRGDVRLEFSFPQSHPETGPRPTTTVLALEVALDQILTERLREQEGLTYGVSTRMSAVAGNQLWEISVTCQPGQSHVVFSIVREELDRVSETGFTGDEIARARLNLTGQSIRNFSDQVSGVKYLQKLAEIGKIPMEPLEEISAVTTEEVNSLARSVIDPGNFIFTATGPLFEEDIEKFDIPWAGED
jgi:predicted Zn-dependent peptidase